jgi:hypothetical protein
MGEYQQSLAQPMGSLPVRGIGTGRCTAPKAGWVELIEKGHFILTSVSDGMRRRDENVIPWLSLKVHMHHM